jgi:hypothetical protein
MHWAGTEGSPAGAGAGGAEAVGIAASEVADLPASVAGVAAAGAGWLPCGDGAAGWPPDELRALVFSGSRRACVARAFGDAAGGCNDDFAGAAGSGSGRGRSSGLSFPSLQLTTSPKARRAKDVAMVRGRGMTGS